MFVNTVCLRGRPDAERPFTEFLAEVSAHALAAFEHQDQRFDDLVARVAPAREVGRNPLFDTMLALQPAELHQLTLLGRPVRLADDSVGQSMFDLNLHVFEHADRLTGVWGYRTGLFVEQTVLAFRDVLLATIDRILAAPQARIGELTDRWAAGTEAAVLAGAAADIDFDF